MHAFNHSGVYREAGGTPQVQEGQEAELQRVQGTNHIPLHHLNYCLLHDKLFQQFSFQVNLTFKFRT